jgi:hypothetical protein
VSNQTIPLDPAQDVLALIRSVRVALEGFETIALLEGTCPLAAETAMGSLRQIKALIAPDVYQSVPASLFIAVVGDDPVARIGALDFEVASEQALDTERRERFENGPVR